MKIDKNQYSKTDKEEKREHIHYHNVRNERRDLPMATEFTSLVTLDKAFKLPAAAQGQNNPN